MYPERSEHLLAVVDPIHFKTWHTLQKVYFCARKTCPNSSIFLPLDMHSKLFISTFVYTVSFANSFFTNIATAIKGDTHMTSTLKGVGWWVRQKEYIVGCRGVRESECSGCPIFIFFIKVNLICAMTRHHAELNIKLLLTRNIPIDSGVGQGSHPLTTPLHCLWAKSNNRTRSQFLKLHVQSQGDGKILDADEQGVGWVLKIRQFSWTLYVYRP